MKTINWSGYEWMLQERWGLIHPEKPYTWYDDTAVEVADNGNLLLKTHKNPRYFPDLNVTPQIGMGIVSCVNKFKYGIYEISAKLPKGKHLWPAFWMWSWNSWPPEIDIFEGYSNSLGSYFTFNPLKPWKVETCLHYTKDGQRTAIPAETHSWGWQNPTNNFLKYRLEWRKDSVKYFYNNKLVRTVTDPLILDQLDTTTMNLIINNHPRSAKASNSVFEIEYFKFVPISC